MPLNISVTQFPGGVGNARDNSVLNSLPLPGPNVALNVMDFGQGEDYASFYASTVIGAGAVLSNPLSSSGILRQVSAGAATDGTKQAASIGSSADSFQFVLGKEAWFGARINLSEVVNEILLLGFIPAAATVAPADGVFLRSADATGNLEIVSRNTGVEVATVIGTLLAATDYDVAFYWDGINKISAQFTGPDGSIGGGGTVIPGALLPAVGLQPSIVSSRGAVAGVTTFDLDYVLFGGSR